MSCSSKRVGASPLTIIAGLHALTRAALAHPYNPSPSCRSQLGPTIPRQLPDPAVQCLGCTKFEVSKHQPSARSLQHAGSKLPSAHPARILS